jgi:hypothetical protein
VLIKDTYFAGNYLESLRFQINFLGTEDNPENNELVIEFERVFNYLLWERIFRLSVPALIVVATLGVIVYVYCANC